MKSNLECKGLEEDDGKPRNNEVWVQRYTVELGAYDAVLKHAGCSKLMPDLFFPKEPKILCLNDVHRCGLGEDEARLPQAWLGQHEDECGTQLGNNILERDVVREQNYT